MKSRRGEFTTEQTVKMFFAVVGLIILIYVGVKVASILIGNHELEQAKSVLDELEAKIELVKPGTPERPKLNDVRQTEFLILNPAKWIFAYVEEKRTFCLSKERFKGDLSAEEVIEFYMKKGICKKIGGSFNLRIGGDFSNWEEKSNVKWVLLTKGKVEKPGENPKRGELPLEMDIVQITDGVEVLFGGGADDISRKMNFKLVPVNSGEMI